MRTNQLKVGVLLSYVIIVLNCVVNIFLTPFLIEKIGESQYGLYQLIGAFVGYLTILDFGLGNTIIRYIAEYRQQQDKRKEANFLASTTLLYIAIVIIIIILAIGLFFNLSNIFPKLTTEELLDAKSMFIILVINLVVTIPGGMFNSIINGYEKYILPRILTIVKTVVRVIALYFVITIGYQAIGIVIVDTILNFLIILINYIICKKQLTIKIHLYSFDKKLIKEIFRYSFYIFLNIIFSQINWKVDQTIIGMKLSTVAVTVYVVGNNFSAVFQQFSTAISGVFLPKVTAMVVNKATNKDLTSFMIKVGRIQAMIIMYIYLAFLLFGNQFITLMFGNGYYEAWTSSLIVMTGLLLPLMENSGLAILQAKKKHRFYVLMDIIIAVFNIIGTYIVIDYIGINGAALMTMITLILGHVILINIYYKYAIKLEVGRFFKEVFTKTSLAWGIIFISVLAITKKMAINSWGMFFVLAIIYTLIYMIIMGFIGTKSEEKQIIKDYFNRYVKGRKEINE